MLYLKRRKIRLADKWFPWPDQISVCCFGKMTMSLHRGATLGRRLLLGNAPGSLLSTSSITVPFYPSLATKRHKATGTPVNVGVMFVPQQEAWLVERMGKFNTILEPGLNFLIPVLDKVPS